MDHENGEWSVMSPARAAAIISTMEHNIVWLHRRHIGSLQAKAMREAVKELMKPTPDEARIQMLQSEAQTLEREKEDKTYARTRQDLIDPLRGYLSIP